MDNMLGDLFSTWGLHRRWLTFILETLESAGGLPPCNWESLDSALRMSWMVVWKVASVILRLVVNVTKCQKWPDMILNLKHMVSSKATEGLYIYHLLCRWQDAVTFVIMTTWHLRPWIFSPPDPAGACFILGASSLLDIPDFPVNSIITNWTKLGGWRHSS